VVVCCLALLLARAFAPLSLLTNMKALAALLLSSFTLSTAFLVAPTAQLRHSFCRVAAELEEGDILLFSDDDAL
jgi:hypothetical protein